MKYTIIKYPNFHYRENYSWDISIEGVDGYYLEYDEELNKWVSSEERRDDSWTSSHASIGNIFNTRKISRLLKKLNLPKNCVVTLQGHWVGQSYIIKIK